MAYVSYSPVREFSGVRSVISAPIFVRSAVVAVAAAVAILTLSEAGMNTVAATAPAALKGDRRVAAAVPDAAPVQAGYVIDVASRTTTVERGASVPLTPNSPFLGGLN